MQNLTIGQLIQSEREMQAVLGMILIEGIGTKQTLAKIESGELQCDKLTGDVLLQRLGKSPDKLEYILRWEEYRRECVRDWFEECVYRNKKKWAEKALQLYQEQVMSMGAVQQMYLYRGRAMIAYWLDRDRTEAKRWLVQALDATFPRWRDAEWKECRISTMELENALALVRVWQEESSFEKTRKKTVSKEETELLERCRKYIDAYVTDGEENAKIYSKYAWLAADTEYRKGRTEAAFELCVDGLNRLREYSIGYFMIPLLQRIVGYQRELRKQGKWKETYTNVHYQEALNALCHLYEQFGEWWYPKDSIFHNCCQKSYHLDFEIVRAERYAHGMTQENVAEGVYENPKEIAKIENRKSSPRGKRFTGLMRKFGLEKERRNGFVVTDSFRVLELRKKIQGLTSRQQYEDIKPLLIELKEQLDMRWLENRRVVQFIQNLIDLDSGNCDYDRMLQKDWEMLEKTYHLSPERLQKPPIMKTRKGKAQVYRAPMKNEAELINQIAIILKRQKKKEDAIQLYEWVLQTFEKSFVNPIYRYHSYGLLSGNVAAYKCSIEESKAAIRYELKCGKAGALGDNYLTLACAMEDDSSNRKKCSEMIKEVYYLFELSLDFVNQKVVEEYYHENYHNNI